MSFRPKKIVRLVVVCDGCLIERKKCELEKWLTEYSTKTHTSQHYCPPCSVARQQVESLQAAGVS